MKRIIKTKAFRYASVPAAISMLAVFSYLPGTVPIKAEQGDSPPEESILSRVLKKPKGNAVLLTEYPTEQNIPTKTTDNPIPRLSARSAIIVDEKTGSILGEYESNKQLPIASLTKLMTALVAIEKTTLSEILQITRSYSQLPAHRLELSEGISITAGNLLKATLINSSNDAAQAIADTLSNNNQDLYISWMNEKAREIGMNSSHFGNAIGLDDGQTYSTTHDLALLARDAMNHDELREIVSQTSATISDVSGRRQWDLTTTHTLMKDQDLHISGIKTGKTPAAGGCLITRAAIDGHPVIVVVLGSSNREQDTMRLIEWTKGTVAWH